MFGSVERALVDAEPIAEDGPFLRLATHQVTLSADQQGIVEALTARLTSAGASPPSRGDLKAQFSLSDELLQVLIDRGRMVEIGDDLVYARQTYDDLVERILDQLLLFVRLPAGAQRRLAEAGLAELTASFRDASG